MEEIKIARRHSEVITLRAEQILETIREHGNELYTDRMLQISRVEVHPEVLAIISKYYSTRMAYSPTPDMGGVRAIAKIRECWGEFELASNLRLVPERAIVYGEEYCEMLSLIEPLTKSISLDSISSHESELTTTKVEDWEVLQRGRLADGANIIEVAADGPCVFEIRTLATKPRTTLKARVDVRPTDYHLSHIRTPPEITKALEVEEEEIDFMEELRKHEF